MSGCRRQQPSRFDSLRYRRRHKRAAFNVELSYGVYQHLLAGQGKASMSHRYPPRHLERDRFPGVGINSA
jgi:hypothetical protein